MPYEADTEIRPKATINVTYWSDKERFIFFRFILDLLLFQPLAVLGVTIVFELQDSDTFGSYYTIKLLSIYKKCISVSGVPRILY